MISAVCFQQVRNLRWLGFRVPLVLVNRAAQASQLHPHAVCLIESVRTYQATCDKVSIFVVRHGTYVNWYKYW